MKPSKKQKGLENIAYLLEKEGVGDVLNLPDDYWKKEAKKFSDTMNKVLVSRIEKVRQKGSKIEIDISLKDNKIPCKKCKKMTALCSFMPCIKFIKWLWGTK